MEIQDYTLNKTIHYFEDRRHLFWLLQIGAWATYGINCCLGDLLVDKMSYNPHYSITSAVMGFLLSLILHRVCRVVIGLKTISKVIVVVSTCYILAVPYNIIKSLVWYHFQAPTPAAMDLWHYLKGITWPFYMFLGWSALYFCITHYRILQEEKGKVLTTLAAAQEAQLKMLRYQLNPHLLFNTINTISTFILERNSKMANKILSNLSTFLRYTLSCDPTQKVPLEQEIAVMKKYLDIEKARLEDRLSLTLNITPTALPALLPAMILQPVIENALKYAVSSREEGGSLTIAAKVENDQLCIDISDNGSGLGSAQPGGGYGMGLANVEQRLNLLYGGRASLRLCDNAKNGLTVSIHLPYEDSA